MEQTNGVEGDAGVNFFCLVANFFCLVAKILTFLNLFVGRAHPYVTSAYGLSWMSGWVGSDSGLF